MPRRPTLPRRAIIVDGRKLLLDERATLGAIAPRSATAAARVPPRAAERQGR